MITPEVKKLFSARKTTPLKMSREMGIAHSYFYDLLNGNRRVEKRRREIARRLRVKYEELARVCGWVDIIGGPQNSVPQN